MDLPALLAHPTLAIAAVHRAALIDATHSWSFLLAEVAALLGVDGPVSGSGTQVDPWRVTVAPGAIAVELAAWNAQTSHVASDPQQLRLGLRASIEGDPWTAWWLTELLAIDLPQMRPARWRCWPGSMPRWCCSRCPPYPSWPACR